MDFKNKKILCVISHPDDETIGCGGFIHSLVRKGSVVSILLVLKSNGNRSKENWNKYLTSFKKACSILGAIPLIHDDL